MSHWVAARTSDGVIEEVSCCPMSSADYVVYPLNEITGTVPGIPETMIGGTINPATKEYTAA